MAVIDTVDGRTPAAAARGRTSDPSDSSERSDRSDPSDRAAATEMYPVILKLAGLPTLVVGGGAVALRKTRELLRCGARVRVVSPEWRADFGPLAAEDRLIRITRPFVPADLDGTFIVFAATDDPATQESVSRLAAERGVLVNVVDVADLGNFFVPATLRRGSLVVSVSTEGKNPFFAVAVRDRLAGVLGPGLGPALEKLGEGRRLARERFPLDKARRLQALESLLAPVAVDHLLEGRLEAFEAHWNAWKSSLSA